MIENTGLSLWLVGPGAAGRVAVGRVYRDQTPAERDAAVLQRLIGAPAFASADECADWVRGAVAADFAAGRTVVVRRWVLSVTEARLGALAVALDP